MRKNATFVRSLHDIGLAGWFGSVAMGALAVNRATGVLDDGRDVGRVTNGVWRRWWPVNAGLIGAYLAGGLGLTYVNRARVAGQRGVLASVFVKNVLTAAALDRVEEIENPLTQQVRYLDKLVDELAKGRKMEKILRAA